MADAHASTLNDEQVMESLQRPTPYIVLFSAPACNLRGKSMERRFDTVTGEWW